MALPPGGPTTDAAVRDLARLRPGDQVARSVRVTAAVNGFVRSLPAAQVADGLPDWTSEDVQAVVEGATMLAARLVLRKNTTGKGSASGSVESSATADPDVAMLLGLGSYTRPSVG